MTTFDSLRNQFTSLIPDLTRMAAAHFRHLDREKQDENVQQTMALAWHAYAALINKGRGQDPDIIFSILWYSVKRAKCGRRIENGCRSKDVYNRARHGHVKFEPIDQFVTDKTSVPDVVSFKIDVPAFLDTLNDRQRRMADALMSGMSTQECARKFDVTPGAVSQFRTRFKDLFDVFMAE